MDKLKIGVIGCGGHGCGHIRGYAAIPQTECIAVADLNPDKARNAAAEFGIPRHYTDYREMLACHTFDIISIATPPAVNRDVAVAAFEAGANVLVSKPLAMNLAEAEEMVAAAAHHGKQMSMGLQNRFDPEVRTLRRFLAEGKLGAVYHTRIWHGHIMHIPPTPTMYKRHLAGGGVLFHTTVHILDATLWALGNLQPVRVSSANHQKMRNMKKPPITWSGPVEACDIEDFNIGLIHFADGSTMTVESNWLMHPRSRPSGAEILGDHGIASLRPLRIELEDGERIVDATPEVPTDTGNHFVGVLNDFCQSILNCRPPVVRFDEMLNVQRIMDALYASAERGCEIDI